MEITWRGYVGIRLTSLAGKLGARIAWQGRDFRRTRRTLKEYGSHATFAVGTMPFPAGKPVVQETQPPAVSRSQPAVWPDAALLTACAGLLLWMLFVPPLIGLAND